MKGILTTKFIHRTLALEDILVPCYHYQVQCFPGLDCGGNLLRQGIKFIFLWFFLGYFGNMFLAWWNAFILEFLLYLPCYFWHHSPLSCPPKMHPLPPSSKVHRLFIAQRPPQQVQHPCTFGVDLWLFLLIVRVGMGQGYSTEVEHCGQPHVLLLCSHTAVGLL